MIYLDTSAALAQLLAEDRHPPDDLWDSPLVASRLLQFEVWSRIHARGLAATHGDAVRSLLARVALLEVIPEIVARALEPFPAPVRTLDALHLASLSFLRAEGLEIQLASYDERMLTAARRMSFDVVRL